MQCLCIKNISWRGMMHACTAFIFVVVVVVVLGGAVWYLFCCAVLCVLPSFAIISLIKRKSWLLNFNCLLDVMLL